MFQYHSWLNHMLIPTLMFIYSFELNGRLFINMFGMFQFFWLFIETSNITWTDKNLILIEIYFKKWNCCFMMFNRIKIKRDIKHVW